MHTEETTRKLARVLCEEADAATLEIGAAVPEDLIPWDLLTDEQREVYNRLADRVLNRLAYNASTGEIVVLNPKGVVIR